MGIGIMKRMSMRTMPGIVVACGLIALAVVALCWAGQVQAAGGYEIGSRDAFLASLFDPFLLTAIPPSRSLATSDSSAPEASVAEAPYVPPIRIPYRPPLRSPSRPPLVW